MADDLTPEQRRKNMQAIRSKDTSIELRLRKALWERGIRYRKNYKKLIGKPDIAITKYRIAVFCDSDYWHGYDWENRNQRIKSNREYWIPKIERNMARDQEVNEALDNIYTSLVENHKETYVDWMNDFISIIVGTFKFPITCALSDCAYNCIAV